MIFPKGYAVITRRSEEESHLAKAKVEYCTAGKSAGCIAQPLVANGILNG